MHSERKLGLDGINSSVDESRRRGNTQLERITKSTNLESHSRLNRKSMRVTIKELLWMFFAISMWKNNATLNYMALMAPFHSKPDGEKERRH
jgi:hypothetical protein